VIHATSDRRDPRGVYRSKLFDRRLNVTVAKVQKGRTDEENFIGGRRNISRRSSSLFPRRETRVPLFLSVASRPAINNVLSSRGWDRVPRGGLLGQTGCRLGRSLEKKGYVWSSALSS